MMMTIMIWRCQDWMKADWDANIRYIYCEQNLVIDKITRLAVNQEDNWRELEAPSVEIKQPLLENYLRASRPRMFPQRCYTH